MSENLNKLYSILKEKKYYDHALNLLEWDFETEAPEKSVKLISETTGFLSEKSYNLIINDEVKDLIKEIEKEDNLSDLDKTTIKELKKTFEKLDKIPIHEYMEYNKLVVESVSKWQEAKKNNDYNIFKPYLEKVIEYNKKFIDYRGYTEHPYNTLLDDYEPNITVRELDLFFDKLKSEIVPLIKKINEKKQIDNNILLEKYNIEKQKEISKYIAEKIGYDFKRGVIKESEHPFSLHFNNKDVRITTHYYEKNIMSSIFSTIHETGHAIYEQNVSDDITDTILGQGTSMGIHESQSRMYENLFGRTYEFWECFLPKLKELYPEQLENVTLEDFYNMINRSETSLIRVEADELTYTLHVMVRYELEKEIFSGNLDIEDLPKIWADKYEKYLGIRPTNFSNGILQDVHWSSGLFGYFPSYALGTAYASQIYDKMSSKLDIKEDIRKGNFENIKEFLRENIHKYGKTKEPKEIIKSICGEDFDSQYYIDYLKNKFSKIYNL